MKKIKLLSLIAAFVAATLSIQSATAKVWRVNNNGFSAAYTDLLSAISNANPHDTIHLEASGTPYAAVTIVKPIVILGPGYFLNLNPGKQKNSLSATVLEIIFNAGSAGSVLSGVSVHQGGNSYIVMNDSNLLIERCYCSGGFSFTNTAAISKITIKQSYTPGGVYTNGNQGPVNNLLISNCYFGASVAGTANFQGSISQCVFKNGVNAASTGVMYQNNIVEGTFTQNTNTYNNVQYNLFVAASLPAWLTGGGNNQFQVNNVFITATGSTDSSLTQNTVGNCANCYKGYPGTEIMGLYGGPDPYLLSGVPNIPAIYYLNSPAETKEGSNVPVNISTRSNN